MTPEQRIVRAGQAGRAWDEFFAPMITNLRREYTDRLTEVASTELHPVQRADKITTLSVALKILGTLEAGMLEAIRDGEVAKLDKLRAEKIESLTDARQRLLRITG